MIKVNDVRKRFGKVTAVQSVSLQVNTGEILGLLGPNGAGKTTTMRMMCGLVKPDAGTIFIDDIDATKHPQLAQQRMGVMPDGGGLYTRLTAWENIAYFAELQNIPAAQWRLRAEELIQILGMGDIVHRRAEGFSHGERTKVCLARALVHSPNIVLLDEPTNGLDVLTTQAVRKLLKHLREQGVAVVFSSHLMHEVNHLCDRAVVVAKGQVVAEGSLEDLLRLSATDNVEDAFVQLAYGDLQQSHEEGATL